ncbi:MAG: hypothetical protein ACRDR6_07375 [Pseudonocardiaceae bacterium]
MSEPTSNALFGTDGTEFPDPTGLTGWRDAPGLPPLSLPAIPNLNMTREAIAAAFSADPHESLEQGSFQHNHDTTPVPRAATPPTSAAPAPTPTNADPAAAPPTTAAPVRAPAKAPVQYTRRLVAAAPPPTQPPTHGPRNARFRPPVAIRSSGGSSGRSRRGSSTAGQFGDFRRRISLPTPRLALPASSDGGAAVFFLIASVIVLVLTYSIVTGIVDSLARLFQ